MKLNYHLNKPIDFVFSYLTDMSKFVTIHPVITRIVPLKENNYKIFETLRVCYIPISFSYLAEINSDIENKIIIMKATIMKYNQIEMNYSLISEKKFCLINEEIKFKSILPIKFILAKIFKKQHEKLFQNMEKI